MSKGKKPSEFTTNDSRLTDKKIDILLALAEPESTVSKTLSVPSYAPDRATREGIQAPSEEWKERQEGILSYQATNGLQVYLAEQKEPLTVDRARDIISQFSASTALTARIALGLWNTRRYEDALAINGAAPVRIEDILAWRGIKKHSHTVSGSSKRYTNGYEAKYKEAVLKDLSLLEKCHVKGLCTVNVKGKYINFEVHSSYLTYSPVYRTDLWGEKMLIGVFLTAGDWINVYDENENKYVAEAERTIFTLHPQNQQHEIRIALYLVEQWRSKAKMQAYASPIRMQDLLRHSAINIDKKHLTDRFAPRIEAALQTLYNLGILGEPATPILPTESYQTGTEWLASEWKLIPPPHVIEHYKQISSPPLSTRKKRTTKQKVQG